MYAYCHKTNVFVRLIRKCASTTIGLTLSETDDARTAKAMLAFIRDPVLRMVSGFRMFASDHWDWRCTPNYELYVDRALAVDEPHWMSQAKFLEQGKWPTHIYPFENLAAVWRDWGLPALVRGPDPALNIPVNTGYRLADIRAHYRLDYALRGE